MISDAVRSAFGRISSGRSDGQQRELDWEAVYTEVWPILIARTSRRGLPQLAPDAVQSALLSILSKPDLLSDFATIDDFLAYASRVSINKAIDSTRRLLKLDPLETVAGTDPADQRSGAMDPLFLYAPRQLSGEERDLMRMFYVEGRTYTEIAALCSTTERTIRTRMFKLQQELVQAAIPR